MSIAREGEALQAAGGSFKLKLSDPFFIGLAVCAHDNKVSEKALFSNVEITTGKAKSGWKSGFGKHFGDDCDWLQRPAGGVSCPSPLRSTKLVARWENAPIQPGGRMYQLPVRGGGSRRRSIPDSLLAATMTMAFRPMAHSW